MTRHLPTLALLVALAVVSLAWCGERRAHARSDRENVRLRTEHAQAALREAGYRSTLGRVAADLRGALAERDHWRALAEQPDAQPVAHVDATATAMARIETPIHTVADTSETLMGYEGQYSDSTFLLRWRLLFGPPPQFAADLLARVPLEMVAYRLPDGAVAITAASRDERVRVDVEDFVWQPPKQRGPSRLRWLLAGVAIGVVGWEALR